MKKLMFAFAAMSALTGLTLFAIEKKLLLAATGTVLDL